MALLAGMLNAPLGPAKVILQQVDRPWVDRPSTFDNAIVEAWEQAPTDGVEVTTAIDASGKSADDKTLRDFNIDVTLTFDSAQHPVLNLLRTNVAPSEYRNMLGLIPKFPDGVMSRDTVGGCLGTSLHFGGCSGIPAVMVAPSSPRSRPGPVGWPAASLDSGCGRHVGPGSGCRPGVAAVCLGGPGGSPRGW
jgi:hypothetical protein